MRNPNHLQSLLNKDHFNAFVALSGDKVVGGLTAYTLDQYYSEKPLAYIYDLAVKRNFQRRGIGKQLILEAIKFYKERGFEELFVQAEKVDDFAIDFYRKTNPSGEDQTVHFNHNLSR